MNYNLLFVNLIIFLIISYPLFKRIHLAKKTLLKNKQNIIYFIVQEEKFFYKSLLCITIFHTILFLIYKVIPSYNLQWLYEKVYTLLINKNNNPTNEIINSDLKLTSFYIVYIIILSSLIYYLHKKPKLAFIYVSTSVFFKLIYKYAIKAIVISGILFFIIEKFILPNFYFIEYMILSSYRNMIIYCFIEYIYV